MQSFTQTQMKKVLTIVKYSKVTFNDGSISTVIKGIKDDSFDYPLLNKVNKTAYTDYYNYKVLSGFDSSKTKFEENDLIINAIRYNVNIPRQLEWSLGNQTIVVESDKALSFEVYDSSNQKLTVLTGSSNNSSNYAYIYNITIELEDVEAGDILQCNVKVYEGSIKTNNVINSSLVINVESSTSPGGD